MKLNFKNFIAMVLFTIVCISVSIPLLNSSTPTINNNIIINPPIVPEEEFENITDNTTNTQILQFKNAFEAYEYGYNILINGKGHNVDFYNVNEATVYGIKESQTIFLNNKRYNNIHLETNIAYSSFEFGENSFKYRYSDEQNVYRLKTLNTVTSGINSIKDIKPIWNDEEVNAYTYEKYITEINEEGFDLYPFTINNETSKVSYFKKDAKYYYFGFNIDVNSLPESYFKIFAPYVDKVEFSSVSMEFVMSRKTGKFISATRKEYGKLTKIITIDVTSQSKYNFISIDTDLTIEMPQEIKDRLN